MSKSKMNPIERPSNIRCPQCTAEGLTEAEQAAGVCYDCQRANRQAAAAYERGLADGRKLWRRGLLDSRERSALTFPGPAEGGEG